MIRETLRLGSPQLYEVSEDVTESDLSLLAGWVDDLHDTLMAYRKSYGAGRAVAAPQIGIKKRLLYMHIGRPFVFINSVLSFPDTEQYICWMTACLFPV